MWHFTAFNPNAELTQFWFQLSFLQVSKIHCVLECFGMVINDRIFTMCLASRVLRPFTFKPLLGRQLFFRKFSILISSDDFLWWNLWVNHISLSTQQLLPPFQKIITSIDLFFAWREPNQTKSWLRNTFCLDLNDREFFTRFLYQQ